jgi:hypothetical protein
MPAVVAALRLGGERLSAVDADPMHGLASVAASRRSDETSSTSCYLPLLTGGPPPVIHLLFARRHLLLFAAPPPVFSAATSCCPSDVCKNRQADRLGSKTTFARVWHRILAIFRLINRIGDFFAVSVRVVDFDPEQQFLKRRLRPSLPFARTFVAVGHWRSLFFVALAGLACSTAG